MATKLTDLASIEKIISEMTVSEKAKIVIGGAPFHTEAMEKYGIPSMSMLDSCNGINSLELIGERVYQKLSAEADASGAPLDREKNGYMGGLLIALGALKKMAIEQAKSGAAPSPKPFGCYPPGIALGSSWNPEAVEKCGKAIAKEMRSFGIDMILGPNINIQRDPLCGRLGESFTEDPYLISQLGPAMVRGIQSEGVIACVKHFAANNQEKDRLGVEEHIPERALREIYLPGFKACADAGCKSIMSAYNKINGKPSAMNPWLLTDILRKEWGYEGFVVSDWGASYDQVAAIAAGNDLTMPGPRGIKCIENAIENGSLTMEKLNECARNVLRAVLWSHAMDKDYPVLNREESLKSMEELLRESMILLKNDGTLPLSTDTRVAFYGKRSKSFTICPAGSSKVETDLATCPYDRAVELLGENNVTYNSSNEDTKYWIAVIGADGCEGTDRQHLQIDEDDKLALEKAISEAGKAGGKVIAIINSTGPVDLNEYSERLNAILCPFMAGIQGGKISTDAAFGLFNPSGKLPMTWPKHYYDCPSYKNFGGENKEVWYGEGIYVGYRWYDARHIEPFYPFGYGLSYTSFEITDVNIHNEINIDKNALDVNISVKNTGKIAGSEVVQLYVHDVECKFDRPEKELKGFKKIHLEPGEEKTITISLGKDAFAGYYMEFGEWIVQPGEFDILIGTSATDIVCTKRINLLCKDPFGWNARTPISTIAKNPAAIEILNRIMEDDILVLTHVALEFAPDKSIGELWGGTNIQGALKNKGWSDEIIADKFRQVLDEFDRL